MLEDGDHRVGLGDIAQDPPPTLRTGTGAHRPNKPVGSTRPSRCARRAAARRPSRDYSVAALRSPHRTAATQHPPWTGRASALLGSAAALVPFAPFRFLAFRAGASVPSAPARASPGTTAERQGEFGASTPAKRSNGNRGGGTNAEIRAKKCTGVITRWGAPFRRGLRSWATDLRQVTGWDQAAPALPQVRRMPGAVLESAGACAGGGRGSR